MHLGSFCLEREGGVGGKMGSRVFCNGRRRGHQCRQHQVKLFDYGKGPNDYRGQSWNRIIKLLPYIRAKPSETDSSFCSVSHHGQFYKPFISTFLHFCISTFLYFYIFIYLHFSFIHFYIFTSETLLKLSISPALKYSRIFKLANIPKYLN